MKAIHKVATVCALAGLLIPAAGGAGAQGLNDPGAIDKIIGSEVKEETTSARADPGRLVAAIENTQQAIATVRKTSNLGEVEIVVVDDANDSPPPEIAAKLEEHKDDVDALRKELEGNAMLYHALDSRNIVLRDVLAVEFEGEQKAVIYAAAEPPGR